MDLETENRIAAILMKEAAELRRQAEKEGVRAYLQKPTIRGRPNSRFLTATVRGVQQANRVVEVNEMWRVRQKELELDDRLRGRSRDESSSDRSRSDFSSSSRSTTKRHSTSDRNASASCSPSKRASDYCQSKEDGGLRDEEVEEFLHSRVKRGRGAVGSRMDETGPFLPPDSKEKLSSPDLRVKRDWERHVLGPEKPYSRNICDSSEEEVDEDKREKSKKSHSGRSHKQDCTKHRSKKSSDKKRKRKEEKRYKLRK